MLVAQEAFSIIKNAGLIDLIKYYALTALACEAKFPYKDEKKLHMLKAKAAVDTLSEVLGGVAAVTMFAIEKGLRSSENAIDLSGLFNTTAVRIMCATTCIGFSVNKVPFAFAPEADDLISRGNLILTFFVITVFRLFCLSVEIASLNMVVARISNESISAKIAPTEEGEGYSELPAGEKEEQQEVTNKAPTNASKAAEIASIEWSKVAERAASVFTGVSPMFICIFFLVALDSVAQGLMIASWLTIPTSWSSS